MTNIASNAQIKTFNQRKGKRGYEELAEKLLISPMLLERFAQGLQIQDQTSFDKIVAWIEGENPQPPVG
jgi:hypothetical protein